METKVINKNFPYSVWALSITVSPLFYIIKMICEQDSIVIGGSLHLYAIFIFIGTIYSIPSLIVFLLTFNLLKMLEATVQLAKVTLSLIGIFCVLTTFYLMNLSTWDELKEFAFYYSAVLIISTSLLKYKKIEKIKEEESVTD